MLSHKEFRRLKRLARQAREIGDRIDKSPDGCWNWTGWLNGAGYGMLGVKTRAHRLVKSFSVDVSGWLVLHKCIDNRRCVNPEHLYLGTDADNTRDKMAQGRYVSGQLKFDESTVREMLALVRSGRSRNSVALEFGMDVSHFCKIVRGLERRGLK